MVMAFLLFTVSCNEGIDLEQEDAPVKTGYTTLQAQNRLKAALTRAGFQATGQTATWTHPSGYQIKTDRILQVAQEDKIHSTFTFEIINRKSGGEFSNLVIQENGDNYVAFVLTYGSKHTYTRMQEFTGTINRFDLEGNWLSEVVLNQGTRSSSTAKQAETCIEDIVTTTYCSRSHRNAKGDYFCDEWVTIIEVYETPCYDPGDPYTPPAGGSGGSPGTGTGGTPVSGGGSPTPGGGTPPVDDGPQPYPVNNPKKPIGVVHPEPEPEPSAPDIAAITGKNFLNAKQKAFLNGAFNEVMNKHAIYQRLFDFLVSKGVKLTFQMDPNAIAPAYYDPATKSIKFRDDSSINADAFGEELFHAYQDAFYEGGLQQFNDEGGKGRANVEFESKVADDIASILRGEQCCMTVQNDQATAYYMWLLELTDDASTFPTNFDEMQTQYYHFMEEFINSQPIYNSPIDRELPPRSMFNLANSGND